MRTRHNNAFDASVIGSIDEIVENLEARLQKDAPVRNETVTATKSRQSVRFWPSEAFRPANAPRIRMGKG